MKINLGIALDYRWRFYSLNNTFKFKGFKMKQLTLNFQTASLVEEAPMTTYRPRVTSASDALVYFQDLVTDDRCSKQEHFCTITLDGASNVIEKRIIFIGTINQSIVHPREVFADAISDRAVGIIIAHNHPSGTLSPSTADVQITNRLKEVGKIVGIEVLDHVIFVPKSKNSGYYSFSEEGML